MPEPIANWIETANKEAKSVDCFDYVPSCPQTLYGFLRVLPAKSYCEWGSGIGVGVGIANHLGLKATGIEQSGELVSKSRSLLRRFEFPADIIEGDLLETSIESDIVFVYCWPGQANQVRSRFESIAGHATWLLMAEGAERMQVYWQNRLA